MNGESLGRFKHVGSSMDSMPGGDLTVQLTINLVILGGLGHYQLYKE